jgi:hypothetical protein
MLRLAIGFVAGYVLGAQAGRKRYEQIVKLTSKIRRSKPVEEATEFVADKVHEVLPGGDKNKVSDPLPAVSAAGSPEKPVIIT